MEAVAKWKRIRNVLRNDRVILIQDELPGIDGKGVRSVSCGWTQGTAKVYL